MLPVERTKEELPYMNYDQGEAVGNLGSNHAQEHYQIEPLVLGDSAVAVTDNHGKGGYGDMIPSKSYDNEYMGMDPNYMNGWNVAKWYEESTPRTTQDSFETASSSNFDVTPEYANYGQRMLYGSVEHGSFSSPRIFESNPPDSLASLYQVGGLDTGFKTVYSSYDAGRMHCSSVESVLRDLSRLENQDRSSMNDYSARSDASLMMPSLSLQQMFSPGSMMSPQGRINRNVSSVTTDDLTTFNTHFEELCNPMKLMMPLQQQMNNGPYNGSMMTRYRLNSNDKSTSLTTGTVGQAPMPSYEQLVNVNMVSHPNRFGQCDPGYVRDMLYSEGQANVTTTPTMRPTTMRSGKRNYDHTTPDMTTYHSDAYNNGDADGMATPCIDNAAVYNAHQAALEGFQSGRLEKNNMEQYPIGLVERPAGTQSELPRCGSIHDMGSRVVKSDPYCDRRVKEKLSHEESLDEYAKTMMEEVPSFQQTSMGGFSQEDYHLPGMEVLDQLNGISDAFKDDDHINTDMDAKTMRRLFENNLYIEDLGHQYELSRDNGPPEEVSIYLRSNVTNEFGAYKIYQEKITPAPTATSAELCEVLMACSSGNVNYQPTIMWDASEQGYVVTWWTADEKGANTKKQTRVFSVNEYSKPVAYDEALRFAKYAETLIRPGALIRWYPGFNIPIGTSGRTNLRKVLHLYRMKNADMCDPVLAANGMKIATKSTFGDMTIVELYKAAYVLGLWDVAAYNCLKTCKRRSYSYRWIHQMQLMNRRITLDALKYLRNVKEALTANRKARRMSRNSAKHTTK